MLIRRRANARIVRNFGCRPGRVDVSRAPVGSARSM
jgi:hypothetical protein